MHGTSAFISLYNQKGAILFPQRTPVVENVARLQRGSFYAQDDSPPILQLICEDGGRIAIDKDEQVNHSKWKVGHSIELSTPLSAAIPVKLL
jgi:hypothetical protein